MAYPCARDELHRLLRVTAGQSGLIRRLFNELRASIERRVPPGCLLLQTLPRLSAPGVAIHVIRMRHPENCSKPCFDGCPSGLCDQRPRCHLPIIAVRNRALQQFRQRLLFRRNIPFERCATPETGRDTSRSESGIAR